MKRSIFVLITGLFIFLTCSSFLPNQEKLFSLSVEVNHPRNNEGSVVFALYNREDGFLDEHYKKYFKKIVGKIENGNASVTFKDLPEGKYAVNILHDEDNDGKIKKNFLLPKEGVGFSNYQSIGVSNKLKFSKVSFNLEGDLKIKVKVIYM